MKKYKLTDKGTTFARKCSVTGEGMNEGWMIDGEYYKYKKDADAKAKTIPNEENPEKGNYKNFKELYESMDEDNNDFCYWTQWEEESDHQYIVKDGKLVEIEEQEKPQGLIEALEEYEGTDFVVNDTLLEFIKEKGGR